MMIGLWWLHLEKLKQNEETKLNTKLKHKSNKPAARSSVQPFIRGFTVQYTLSLVVYQLRFGGKIVAQKEKSI